MKCELTIKNKGTVNLLVDGISKGVKVRIDFFLVGYFILEPKDCGSVHDSVQDVTN